MVEAIVCRQEANKSGGNIFIIPGICFLVAAILSVQLAHAEAHLTEPPEWSVKYEFGAVNWEDFADMNLACLAWAKNFSEGKGWLFGRVQSCSTSQGSLFVTFFASDPSDPYHPYSRGRYAIGGSAAVCHSGVTR